MPSITQALKDTVFYLDPAKVTVQSTALVALSTLPLWDGKMVWNEGRLGWIPAVLPCRLPSGKQLTDLKLSLRENLADTHAGQYKVRVTGAQGVVDSSTVTVSIDHTPRAPTISLNPASVSLALNQLTILSVGAEGTAPLSYVWHKDGQVLAYESRNYTPIMGSRSAAGEYHVVVSNATGIATSTKAKVTFKE